MNEWKWEMCDAVLGFYHFGAISRLFSKPNFNVNLSKKIQWCTTRLGPCPYRIWNDSVGIKYFLKIIEDELCDTVLGFYNFRGVSRLCSRPNFIMNLPNKIQWCTTRLGPCPYRIWNDSVGIKYFSKIIEDESCAIPCSVFTISELFQDFFQSPISL